MNRSLSLCASLLVALGISSASAQTASQSDSIWSLGQPDGASSEFAPGARGELTYTVGQSVLKRDFPAHQEGSLGFDNSLFEHPYIVAFDLPEAPEGNYELVLDLIYKSGAPERLKIKVNDRRGIFPIRPVLKKATDTEEGNLIFLSKQRFVVPIPASWLKTKGNQIKFVPLGLGGIDYDAISFRKVNGASSAPAQTLRVEPTIFFRKAKGRQCEVCDVLIPFQKKFSQGKVSVAGPGKASATFTNTLYDFGVWSEAVCLPTGSDWTRVEVKAALDGESLQAEQEIAQARRWKMFVCPKVHNDVGYTDLQPNVHELDSRNADLVLDILGKYPFYKFNYETSWLMENYLYCRTPEWRKKLLDYARNGRISINAFYLNLMTGICSGEELYRATYLTHRLHRAIGSNFDFACLTDTPSHSWFLPTLLKDIGIKGFSDGSNQTRAPIVHLTDLNEISPFYWEGMNGERILMWYSRAYSQLSQLTAGARVPVEPNVGYAKGTVSQFLLRFERENYTPDAVMIYGAYGDNAAIPETGEAAVIAKWNQTFEYPKLILSSDADYFRYIENNFADRLPVRRGDCGAYWEDGAASTAKATTLNRQSQQLLPEAETAASLAALFDSRDRYPAEDFRNAWENIMFYDEHTWGAFNSLSQPDRQFVTRQWEIKEEHAVWADLETRDLLLRAHNRLCQNIAVPESTIFAFNWQNRVRSEPLEVEIGRDDQIVDPVSNQPVPLDVVFERDGYLRVRFLAENVPAMGYRGYLQRWVGAAKNPENQKQIGNVIENDFYRLTIDLATGAIKSLIDKGESRELVDCAAGYRVNEYLYVSGGEQSLIENFTANTPPPRLAINTPSSAKIIENVRTPFGHRLVIETSAKNTPVIRSAYMLYDKLKRLDIVNSFDKEEIRAKEAVYFAFPFAAENPGFEYQIQNGWVRPNQDQMPGACREWFTPQNLVHVQDGAHSVAWATPDAPLVTLTDINRGKWMTNLDIGNGHVFSYALNNYWMTNYKARQGGHFTFRYSITSGKAMTREQLADFDADTRCPVLAYPYISTYSANVAQQNRPLPVASGSFLSMDAPNLQMVAFKPAEDGEGYILRFREIAGQTGEAELKLPTIRLRAAFLCNGVEDNRADLSTRPHAVKVPYKPYSYITVRLVGVSAIKEKAKKSVTMK